MPHTNAPRFGIATAPQQVTYHDVLRVWREADSIPQIEHAWLFDHLMPIGGDPNGPIAEVITKAFGNFKDFQTKFNDAGVKQFGSGWVWLAGKSSGEVQILSTPNQDNPLSQGLFPIFGNDVWEHAYYLKYNNRRPEYLAAWWNIVNWDEINKRYAAFKSGKTVNEPAMAHR